VTLGVSVKTAETHRTNIMRKLGLHSVAQLTLYAARNGLVQVFGDDRHQFPAMQTGPGS